MKTALILTAALSAAPASQPPIEIFALQPGETIACGAPEGCVALTASEMKRLLDHFDKKCEAPKRGMSI